MTRDVVVRVGPSDLNPTQRKFLLDESPYLLFSAGFGAGKTTVGGLKALQLATDNPGVPGLIVGRSWTSLKSTVLRSMRRILGRNMPKITDPTGERYLDLGGGSHVFLRTAQNPDLLDGLDVGWLYADEIRHYRKEAYDIMIGRVRIKCPFPQRAFTSTPSMGWMADEFNTGKKNRKVLFAGTKENLHNLDPDYLEELRRSYSPRLQRAVLDGRFTILEGAVYDDFDPETGDWVVDWYPTADDLRNKQVDLAVDPGYRKSAWLFIIERKPGEWVVFDQMMPNNASDIACVAAVNDKGYPIDEVWCDPAGDNTQSVAAADTIDALRHIVPRERGKRLIRSVTRFRSIAFGVDKTRTLIGGWQGSKIRIKFAKRLVEAETGEERGIYQDLQRYRYADIKDGRPLSDTPIKDGVSDHSNDALRYWAVGKWMTVPWLREKLKAFEGLDSTNGPGYKVY